MRLLAIDIGGFTQDILILDTSEKIENCFKMVLPSPTVILAKKINAATSAKRPIMLTGVNMGGGYSSKALSNHLKAGLKAFATREAATTFNDNVAEVAEMGVVILDEPERPSVSNLEVLETKDLDLLNLNKLMISFGIEPELDGIAVAVFDHGAAPPEVSDRIFRFQHLKQTICNRPQLGAFAYLAEEIPPPLTRMQAVAKTSKKGVPLLVMDTPIAAAIGSLEDPRVSCHTHKIIMNVGNLHTLAFHLQGDTILGVFEHHTRLLTRSKAENLIEGLVKGTLTNDAVYQDGGHGCLVLNTGSEIPFLSVTGPQRVLMTGSNLNPYFAVPYGDMMLTGCFGLARAFTDRFERWQGEIDNSLRSLGSN